MATTEAYAARLAVLSAAVLCIFSIPVPSAFGQDILTAQSLDSEEVQEAQKNSEPISAASTENIQEKTANFAEQIEKYKKEEITRLRLTNQIFSIIFVVSGIMLTFASTALGAVESQNTQVQKRAKFTISILGGLAVFFQALNSAFPVTKRAGAYASIKSEITILEFKLSDVTDESQLQDIKDRFYKLIQQAGAAEAENG